MRQLTPRTKSKELKPVQITDEQYKELLHILDEIRGLSDTNASDIDALKNDLSNGLSTGTLDASTVTAVNAILESVAADTIGADKAAFDEATISQLRSAFARIDTINSDNIVTDTVKSNTSIETPHLTSGDIVTESITADEANFSNFNADNFEADKIKSEQITASESVSTPHIDATEGVFDDLTSDTFATNKLDSPEAVIDDLYSEVIHNRFMLHDAKFNRMDLDKFSLAADGKWWCVLPKFVNGKYDLVAREESTDENGNIVLGPYLWAMEILNDTKNLSFTWSVKGDDQYLLEVDIVEDASDELQYIQIHGQLGGKHTAVYYRCDSHETTLPPVFYGTKQVDGTKNFVFNRQAGRWIPNSTFAGEFHAESMLIDDVEFETVTITHNIRLPIAYDQYGAPTGYHRGTANQYIRNIEDEFGNEGLEWASPADAITRNDDHLVTSDTVSRYDGSTVTGKDDDDQEIIEYPIKHINEDAIAHGKLEIKGTLYSSKHLYIGPEDNLPDDIEDDALVLFTELSEDSEYEANVFYRKRDIDLEPAYIKFATYENAKNNKPAIYDSERDTFTTTDELSIDKGNFNKIVVDDLTVNGVAHIENTEEETVQGDFITVRMNNDNELAEGTYSGLLINNFKENQIGAIVFDSEGVARVGWCTGQLFDIAADLYYKDGSYYYDEELTDPAEFPGILVSWESYEEIDTEDGTIKHWTNPVSREITFDDTQPFLTRDEEENLDNQGILKYDKDNSRADTIELPNKSEQLLTSNLIEHSDEEDAYFASIEGEMYDAELNIVDVSEYEYVDDSEATFDKSGSLFKDNDKLYYFDGTDYFDVTGFDFDNLEVLISENPTEDDTSSFDSDQAILVAYRDTFITKPEIKAHTEYKWIDKPAGIYRFATEEEYEEYAANNNIPTNSLIYIDEPTTYVWGEWQSRGE